MALTADSKRQVISVNVGTPREVEVRGGTVLTAIWKSPVVQRTEVRGHNLAGDRQADLTVHGGPHKAVYLYSSEHYVFWRGQFPGMDLPFGMFGENLTTLGMLEDTVSIGDRFRIGTVTLQVTQPRMPCFKLGLRFDRTDIVKRFWQSGRSGIYFSVVEEGELGAGDAIEQVHADEGHVTDVVRLYRGDETDPDLFQRALKAPLHGGWRQGIRERFAATSASAPKP